MGKTMCAISLILANPLRGGSALPPPSAGSVWGVSPSKATWGAPPVLAAAQG